MSVRASGDLAPGDAVQAGHRASRWRVLVIARATWDASSTQLAIMAQALHDEGAAVHVAAPQLVHARLQQLLPDLTVRAVDARGSTRRDAVQAMSTSLRANVALVDGEDTRRLAVRVLSDGACVLQRLPLHTSLPADSLVTRLMTRRMHLAYLLPQLEGEVAHSHAERKQRVFPLPVGTFTPENVSVTQAESGAPVLVVVPDDLDAMGALPALRAAARILQRHHALRVHLLGPPRLLQGLRVQAAALHIAAHVTTGPLNLDLFAAPAGTMAAWISASGDNGAAALLGAMAGRIPVLVPASSPLAPLVADHVTGMIVNERDPLGDALAAGHLARLLGQGEQQRSMAAAARARVQRLHSGERVAAAVLDALDALTTADRRAA